MSKFTPGPWTTNVLDQSIGSIETADGSQAIGHAFEISAADRNAGGPIRKANALLMAAAPDLLAACQAIVWAHDRDHPAAEILDENSPLLGAIRDAIAKAEGQS